MMLGGTELRFLAIMLRPALATEHFSHAAYCYSPVQQTSQILSMLFPASAASSRTCRLTTTFSPLFAGRLRHMPHSIVYEPAKGCSVTPSEHAFVLHARGDSLFWLELAAEAASALDSPAKTALFPNAMFSKLQIMRETSIVRQKPLPSVVERTDPMRASVCIATCEESPRLVASGAGLLRALQHCGLPVQQRPWNSVGGWHEFSHICIMQTWDYPSHL